METFTIDEDPNKIRQIELERLVRDWREFLHFTALSVGERYDFSIWDIAWLERNLDLEKRSRKLVSIDPL